MLGTKTSFSATSVSIRVSSSPKQELDDRLKFQLTPGVNDAATLDSLLKMHTALYAKLEALRAQGLGAGEG